MQVESRGLGHTNSNILFSLKAIIIDKLSIHCITQRKPIEFSLYVIRYTQIYIFIFIYNNLHNEKD